MFSRSKTTTELKYAARDSSAPSSARTTSAVDAAQRSLDISTAQYKAGTVSYLQVITAQTALLQNQRSSTDLLTRRLAASVQLIEALGGGWDAAQLPTSESLCREAAAAK